MAHKAIKWNYKEDFVQKRNVIASLLTDAAIANLMHKSNLKQRQRSVHKVNNIAQQMVMDSSGKLTRADKIIEKFQAEYRNSGLAMDIDGYYGLGANSVYVNQVNSTLIDNFFLGYAELSLLTQNALLSNVCSTWSDTMTSRWIKFNSTDKYVDKTDRIKQLEAEHQRLGTKDHFNRALYMSFAQGGCMIYPAIQNKSEELTYQSAELLSSTEALANPLYLDSGMQLSKGDRIAYLAVVEPIWYVPIEYNTAFPLMPDFYKPQLYSAIGTTIHISRLLKFITNDPPNIIKPQYLFNGIPLLQQCIPYVMGFEAIRNNIIKIVQRYNLTILKTGAEALINDASTNTAENAAANMNNRLQLFNMLRDNFGILALDKDLEDIDQLTMSLSHLEQLHDALLQDISSATKIPPIKLTGQAPGGLNSTGEYEVKNFYQNAHCYQEKVMRHNLQRLNEMIMLGLWGEIDRQIDFQFIKLDEASELEQSTIRLNLAQEAAIYTNAGILIPTDVRTRLATDEDSGWNNIEVNDSEFNKMQQLKQKEQSMVLNKENINNDKRAGV